MPGGRNVTHLSARKLRRLLLLSSISSLFLTLVIVVAVSYLPLKDTFNQTARRNLVHETRMLSQIINETLKRASDLGWQVSSRTAARRITGEYHSGKMSFEVAAERLKPIIRDAVEFTQDVRGLLRTDMKGRILVRSGPAALDTMISTPGGYPVMIQPPLQFVNHGRQRFSDVFELGRQHYFVVYTPVYSPDQVEVGQDLLLFSLDNLGQLLTQASRDGYEGQIFGAKNQVGQLENVLGTGNAFSLEEMKVLTGQKADQVSTFSNRLSCVREIPGSSWWLCLQTRPGAFLPDAAAIIKNVALSVLLIGLLSLAGSFFLLRPLREKILIAQEDSRRQIADLSGIRKNLEEQGRQLEQRHQDLQHFARASAHDLKSPLISIGGHARVLLEKSGSELNDKQRQSLEFILQSAKRMHRHIEDMLNYSLAAEGDAIWEKVQLKALVDELLLGMESLIRGSSAQIEIEELCTANGDRRLFLMILHNLIENALNYSQPGEIPHIRLSTRRQDDLLFIIVEDKGLGIDAELHGRVFESYYRIPQKSQRSGSGLGLAIVERAVKRMQGSISLESEPGKGSCFTIMIPNQRTSILDELKPLDDVSG
jgi:signal transduction histidine kinase